MHPGLNALQAARNHAAGSTPPLGPREAFDRVALRRCLVVILGWTGFLAAFTLCRTVPGRRGQRMVLRHGSAMVLVILLIALTGTESINQAGEATGKPTTTHLRSPMTSTQTSGCLVQIPDGSDIFSHQHACRCR